MDDDKIKDLLDATQSFKDLMSDTTELMEDIEEVSKSEIDLNTIYPKLIFKTEDLVRTMNLCSKLIQPKSDNIAYNSISIAPVPELNTINFYVTNDLSHFRLTTELIGGNSNSINEIISIPFITLQRVIKLAGSKILIYKREDNLYIRLLGGDLLLDYRSIDMKYLQFPGEIKEKIADLGLDNIGSIVNVALPLLNSELRGDIRRINFTGEKAYYNSSFYYLESVIETPKISLSLKDSEFINKLYKYYKGKQIQLFKVESNLSRLFLKLDNIEYEFINSVHTISPTFLEQIDKLVSPIEVIVNHGRFVQVVTLATMLPSSTGTIGLSYKNNKLIIKISSNRGESEFTFDTKLEKEHLYNKEIFVRAETLRKLLNAFSSVDKVGVALSDLGITLEYNGIKAVMMHTDI